MSGFTIQGQLHQYAADETLARTRHGKIKSGRNLSTNDPVVIKIINVTSQDVDTTSKLRKEACQAEAALLIRLQHPVRRSPAEPTAAA